MRKNYYTYIAVGGENKILHYETCKETGKLQLQAEVALSGSPGPLAIDPKQRFLYVGLRSTNEIASFHIDPATGMLSPFGNPVSLKADPCYLSIDCTGRFLLASYYGAGKVTVHPIGMDGAVAEQPVVDRPTAQRAHCIQTDRSNRYVFVPHTAGPNLIFQFIFDEQSGRLEPNSIPQVIPADGEGPRHYVYHPALDVVYFSNEQGCSVTVYDLDNAVGTLTPKQTLSTLPIGYIGENTCAQIHIHPSGNYLYVSNRGHDSIATFAIDHTSGRLSTLGHYPTEPIPRTFNLDPTGNFLYVAGQGSGQLAAYRIDPSTGGLNDLNTYEVGERPMWVLILESTT